MRKFKLRFLVGFILALMSTRAMACEASYDVLAVNFRRNRI